MADVSYHVVIEFNQSVLTVSIDDHTTRFQRGPTANQFIATEVPVWWMSNKFGSTQYYKGNGTFSDITIRSTLLTDSPSVLPTEMPTLAPTAMPTTSTPTYAPTTNSPSESHPDPLVSETQSMDTAPPLTTQHLESSQDIEAETASASDNVTSFSSSSSMVSITLITMMISVLFLCVIGAICAFVYHRKWHQRKLSSLDKERGLKQVQFTRKQHELVRMQSPSEFEQEDATNSGQQRSDNYLEVNLGVHYDDDSAPSAPSSFEVIGSFENEVMTKGYEHDSNEERMVNLELKIWVDSTGPHHQNVEDPQYSPVGRIRGQTEGKMRSPGRMSRTPSNRTPSATRTSGKTPSGKTMMMMTHGKHSGEQSVEYDLGAITEDVYAE